MDVKNSNNNDENINVEELEKLRLNLKKKSSNIFVFSLIGILLFVCLFVFFMKDEILGDNFFFFVIIFVFCLFVAFSSSRSEIMNDKKYDEFSRKYKIYIVKSVFDNLFDEVIYNIDNNINLNSFVDSVKSTNMISMGDDFHVSDYICGKYKGVNFEYSDFYTIVKNDGNANLLFAGQWLIFDFNKKFKFDFQVCEKDFKNSIVDESIFKKVELEDISFNNLFNVYSQNELETFYVLTPNTIEKLKELNNKINGSMLFCFVDNKLHIGLHNEKDSFEGDVFSEINLEEEKEKIYEEIKVILSFIDILNLDNRLFK